MTSGTALVVDTSFVAALFLPDEQSENIESILKDAAGGHEIITTSLFWYEISNVLTVAVKCKRLSYNQVRQVLSLIGNIGMTTDTACGVGYSRELTDIASRYELSAYDAGYLELAIRIRGRIATLDLSLTAAARSAGIEISN